MSKNLDPIKPEPSNSSSISNQKIFDLTQNTPNDLNFFPSYPDFKSQKSEQWAKAPEMLKDNTSAEKDLNQKREEALQRKLLFKQKHNLTPPPKQNFSPPKRVSAGELIWIDPKPKAKTLLSFELHSKGEIIMKPDGALSQRLKDIVSLHGKKNPENSEWVIPVSSYETLKSELKKRTDVIVEAIPSFVLNALSEKAENFSNLNKPSEKTKSLSDIPNEILRKLYPFQADGVQFVLSRHGRALIGDEMGVGKTIQAIISSYAYYNEWPVLVICPASIKNNWRDEYIKWLPFLEKKDFYFLDTKKFSNNNAKVWIASYSIATTNESNLKSKVFNVIIADECHYLKNFAAKRTKCILPLLQKAKRAIMLSGTPILSRPSELFTILSAIRP